VLPETHNIENFRIMLCPLVYGAGIKGKITDSWYYGTPCISSLIGGEGLLLEEIESEESRTDRKSLVDRLNDVFTNYDTNMLQPSKENWGGVYSNNLDILIENSYELYKNNDLWQKKVRLGREILRKRMSFDNNFRNFEKMIEKTAFRRNSCNNLYQRILMNENSRSTKYMSKYIEIKSKLI
jgi:hypothetical protein